MRPSLMTLTWVVSDRSVFDQHMFSLPDNLLFSLFFLLSKFPESRVLDSLFPAECFIFGENVLCEHYRENFTTT
jgi:hypothetical protein